MAPLTAGVHHMGLTVPDLAAAAAFFIDVLGYTKTGADEVRWVLVDASSPPVATARRRDGKESDRSGCAARGLRPLWLRPQPAARKLNPD